MAEPCGCRVEELGEGYGHAPEGPTIIYCPLHAAADDLLAALEDALEELHYHFGCDPECERKRHAAIAKAKGEA